MFNNLFDRDFRPYASGMRWYHIRFFVEDVGGHQYKLRVAEADFPDYNTDDGVPDPINGVSVVIGDYGKIYLTNLFVTDLKIVPTDEALINSTQLQLATSYTNLEFANSNGDTRFSAFEFQPSADYLVQEIDAYILGKEIGHNLPFDPTVIQ